MTDDLWLDDEIIGEAEWSEDNAIVFVDDALDAPEPIAERGPFALYQSDKPVKLPYRPVKAMREKLADDLERIIYSEQCGAWLLRHPPGAGKTFAFSEIAKDLSQGLVSMPIIGCAPTIAEAEKMSAATGIKIVYAQNTTNCTQMADEATMPKDKQRLRMHLEGKHAGSDFCNTCQHVHRCRSTPGQYRFEQKEFARECAKGTVQAIITVAMLKYAAPRILKSKRRIVIWTDEDLMPHVEQEVEPIDHDTITGWLRHAEACGEVAECDMALMREAEAILGRTRLPEGKTLETVEDHGTADGRAFRLTPADVLTMRDLIAACIKHHGGKIPLTHPTEQMTEQGEFLQPGFWRPAVFRQVITLFSGVLWCHIDKSDFRSFIGVGINRGLLDLAKTHCFLQSDATASAAIWAGVWGTSWRGALDDTPERRISVEWSPASVAAKDDERLVEAETRALIAQKAHPGIVGILCFKKWKERLASKLAGRGYRVYLLPDKKPDTAPEFYDTKTGAARYDFILGHFGAHDRGINDFHEARLSAFCVFGSHRPPMSAWHQRCGTLLELGVKVPHAKCAAKSRAFPVDQTGKYVVQSAHRAMASNDPRTNWVADYERGAHLSQAIERVRSVDRATEKLDLWPIKVYLWGPEACVPTIPLPIHYTF